MAIRQLPYIRSNHLTTPMKYLAVVLLASIACLSSLAQDAIMPIAVEKPVRGLYKSFEEFKYNVPSIRDSFNIRGHARTAPKWKGTTSYKPYYEETGARAYGLWGFSDGEHCFFYHDGEFFEVSLDSAVLGFYAYASQGSEGMLVGAAMSPSSAGTGMALAGYAIADELNKKTRKFYFMNPYSGGYSTNPNAKGMDDKTLPTTSSMVVFRVKKKESEVPVTVSVDGEEISLVPSTVVEFSFPISREPIEVCYGKDLSECYTFYPLSAKAKFFRASFNGKTEKLDEINYNGGLSLSNKTKKEQEKRQRKAGK